MSAIEYEICSLVVGGFCPPTLPTTVASQFHLLLFHSLLDVGPALRLGVQQTSVGVLRRADLGVRRAVVGHQELLAGRDVPEHAPAHDGPPAVVAQRVGRVWLAPARLGSARPAHARVPPRSASYEPASFAQAFSTSEGQSSP